MNVGFEQSKVSNNNLLRPVLTDSNRHAYNLDKSVSDVKVRPVFM